VEVAPRRRLVAVLVVALRARGRDQRRRASLREWRGVLPWPLARVGRRRGASATGAGGGGQQCAWRRRCGLGEGACCGGGGCGAEERRGGSLYWASKAVEGRNASVAGRRARWGAINGVGATAVLAGVAERREHRGRRRARGGGGPVAAGLVAARLERRGGGAVREQCAYNGASGETARRRDKVGSGERHGRVERVRSCVDGRVAVSGLATCDARQSGAASGGRRGGRRSRVVHAWAADARVPHVETAGSGVRACAWTGAGSGRGEGGGRRAAHDASCVRERGRGEEGERGGGKRKEKEKMKKRKGRKGEKKKKKGEKGEKMSARRQDSRRPL